MHSRPICSFVSAETDLNSRMRAWLRACAAMADMNGVVVPLATPEGKELLLKLEGSRFGAQSKSMLRSFSKQCNNKFCGVTSNVNCINSLCEMDSLRNKYSGDLTPSLQQEQVFLSEKVKHALDEQAVRQ